MGTLSGRSPLHADLEDDTRVKLRGKMNRRQSAATKHKWKPGTMSGRQQRADIGMQGLWIQNYWTQIINKFCLKE